MIAAHPDDENTALLGELALGQGADVAYMSLTRGEGGQNLIGPELEEGLGLIRSEELLAARRLDGAQQFFSRAYDFGFSKSAEESFAHWPHDSILSDVIGVVRRFRPDIIVAVFSGTPRDGHGQHQVSGIVAREAFEAAADPGRFPEQIRQGLSPWQTKYFFQSLWRGSTDSALTLSTGDIDPLLGRSHYQVAMESRSRHRSQDMGQPQPLGPRSVSLDPQKGPFPDGASSPFAGVDTTLAQWAQETGAPGRAAALLSEYGDLAARARAGYNPFHPDSILPLLTHALLLLDSADAIVTGASRAGASDLRFRIASEREDALRAAWAAADLVFDATVEQPRVVQGEDFELALKAWNGSPTPVRIERLEPVLPDGWKATPLDPAPSAPLAPDSLVSRRFRVSVPADARVTEPYYLRRPRDGDLYRWPDDPSVRGLPFAPAQVRAAIAATVDGVTLDRQAAATFVDVDKAVGERRIPVLVVPAIWVAVRPEITVVPLERGVAKVVSDGAGSSDSRASEFTVEVRSSASKPLSGRVTVRAPSGWTAEPQSADVTLQHAGDSKSVSFTLSPPASPRAGRDTVHAVFTTADGRSYDRGYTVIDYPHIRPHPLYHEADAVISAFPVSVPAGLRVGYVMGAGDDGPEALRQLGVSVDLLDAAALATGDLSRYDAIVTGIRAYEVRPDLDADNARLLDYARRGGTLVVQYNKYEYPQGGYAPWPLTIARPHDRVTDEGAKVRLLEPDHPALSKPNRITPADFEGWVHDMGLYYAHTWDEHYTPLLAMSDPGEPPLRGGLLVGKLGKGWFAYTGLALFRQLPEGVPGAYRLLANLVSLGR